MKASMDAMCAAYGIPRPVAEFRFAPPRKWRFDYAWVENKLALEVQGGIWTGGRHVRGAALLKEHEKLNAAAKNGWRLLYCTPAELKSGAIFATVREALAL